MPPVGPDSKTIPQIWLLAASEETPRGTHDLRRKDLKIPFSEDSLGVLTGPEPNWDPVAELRVQAHQPGMDHRGIFSLGEHPDQLEGKPQTLFGIALELAPAHPPVDGAHVLDGTDRGGEVSAD